MAGMTTPSSADSSISRYLPATSAAGSPGVGSIPIPARVSAIQPGDTAFTLMPRPISSEADRTNPSIAQFTVVAMQLPG